MKVIILITLSILGIREQTYSQQKWFDDSSKWTYEYGGFWFGGIIGYEEIVVEGEVEIQGKVCKKLKKEIIINDSLNNPIIYDEQFDYVYENNDTIYHLIGSEFIPIYNFTLLEGDTFELYTTSVIGRNLFCLVDSIGQVEMNNQILKKQFIHSWDPLSNAFNYEFEIIERVGFTSIYFFLSQVSNFAIADASFKYFKCYEDDLINYENPSNQTACNYLPTVTRIEELDLENLVNVSPNPFNESFDVNVRGKKIEFVEIYSLRGELITKIRKNYSELGSELEGNGIYIVRIQLEENKTILKKVVKR